MKKKISAKAATTTRAERKRTSIALKNLPMTKTVLPYLRYISKRDGPDYILYCYVTFKCETVRVWNVIHIYILFPVEMR